MARLDDINNPYVPAAKTNIHQTFVKRGWVPPSQNPWFQDKWNTYRNLSIIHDGGKNEVHNTKRVSSKSPEKA